VLDDTFVTGFTFSSNNIILTQNRVDQYSAFTINLSGLTVYVTGGTYNNNTGTATFVNSTGGTFQVTGFTTGITSNVSGAYLPLSGGTVTGNTIFQSGLTANIISATTYLNLPVSNFTGGTVSGATLFTGGLSANTFSATTYLNLPIDPDIYVTGFTFNPITYLLDLKQNTTNNLYSAFTANLAVLASDVTITGGTYNPTTGVATFTNNSGGTFNVSGFTSGLTDTVINSFNYTPSANTFTINDSRGSAFTATFASVSGLTVNGNLTVSGGSVGIGTATPSASALFEMSSTTKGFLGPRMTEAQRLAISATTGLIVYQTDNDEGYYIYKSFGWVQII
jgi:hypothetical protein